MYKVLIRGLIGWCFSDEQHKNIEEAKKEVEKRINNGTALTNLKIVQECEALEVKIV